MKKEKVIPIETDGVQYRRATTGQIVLAEFSYLPMILLSVLMTYVSYLQSAGYGIATAVAGVILTFITLFDGVTDPIAARIIDNFDTKHGKIRIMLWIGYIISAVTVFIMFCVTGTGKFGVVTFILLDMLFYIGYTIYAVTQAIIPPVLTNDPKQRPMVNFWATIIGVLPPIVLMVLVSYFMLPRYGNEYTLPLLRELCIIVLVIGTAALGISMIGLKNCDKPENFAGLKAQKETIGFKDMVTMFKENKALRAYFWSAASDRLATTVAGQSVVTTLLAGILFKNMGLFGLISMIPMLLGMVGLVFCAKYNGKTGSKKGVQFWSWLGIGISVVQFVVYYVLMLQGKLDQMLSSGILLMVFCLLSTVRNIINNGNGNATNMMMADVIDYQCYLTGKYMPAAVTATYSFLDKLINSLGSSISLGLIAMIGYTATMPQPTDEATMPIFFVTMFISLGLPAIGWIVNIIAMRGNPLTKEKMVEVQKTIADKKKELEVA